MKPIWGSQCLHSGPQSSLVRGPKTGSTHWSTVAIVSQPTCWAIEARPEVALPTTGRGEGELGGLLGRGTERAPFPLPSPSPSST